MGDFLAGLVIIGGCCLVIKALISDSNRRVKERNEAEKSNCEPEQETEDGLASRHHAEIENEKKTLQ